MKKLLVLTGFFLLIGSTTVFSQEKTPSQTGIQKQDTRTNEEKIASYKYHLKALDEKEAYIRSNPEEYKIAVEQGWFEKADKTRQELKAQIEELESK